MLQIISLVTTNPHAFLEPLHSTVLNSFRENKGDLSGSQKNSTGSFTEQDLFADAREMWLPFKELFHHRHGLLFLIFQAI